MSSPTHDAHHPPRGDKRQRNRLVPIRFFSTRSMDGPTPTHANHDRPPKKREGDDDDGGHRPAPTFGA
eukprot:48822-Eustigmatos_ZCMA.PRE.1